MDQAPNTDQTPSKPASKSIAGEAGTPPKDAPVPSPGLKHSAPPSPQVSGNISSMFSAATNEKFVFLPTSESKVPPLMLAIPPAVETAEGYVELVTQAATKLGVSRSMKRKFARNALKLAMECGECWYNAKHEARRQMVIGQSLRLLRRYPTAMIAFRKAAKHRPNRPDALMALACCQRRSGLIREAIATLTRALAITPESGPLHYNLACYLCVAGEGRAAIYELAWAVELDSSLKKRAVMDSDFDALRGAPAFFALTASCSIAK